MPALSCDSNVVVTLTGDTTFFYTITNSAAGSIGLSTCNADTDIDTVRVQNLGVNTRTLDYSADKACSIMTTT